MKHISKGLLVSLLSVAAAAAATVSIQPPIAVIGPGQFVMVDVHIDSVGDLYAWQFDISFDPGILAAQAVTEGDFLSTGGPTFFLPGTIDNIGGTITFNGDTLEGNIPGVSGSGLLAQVQFQAIALGTSAVGLANVSLLDSELNNIDAATMDGSVVSSSTPEPSARWILACCLLALLLARKAARGSSLAVLLVVGALFGQVRAADIPTGQFDAARTMANGSEIYLTTSTVSTSHFGKLFARTVDGAIFAQPLYLQGMLINSRKVNVVYVATSHNNVYAFDADDPNASSPLWSVNLGQYDTPSGWNTGVGILSTPQIVRSSNAIYLTAATNENGGRVYRLHALDLLTGAEKFGGPVVIAGSVPGTAGDSVNGFLTFNANFHVQRTGLALSGTNVIFAFSADRDHPPYHGWVFSYNIGNTLSQTGIFSDTVNNISDFGTGAGIWHSGRAPAVDSNGAIYFETGNGAFDGTLDFGQSFLKLSAGTGLSLSDWFTPSAWQALNDVDYDLSSTGPTLVPGANMVFGGSKSGTIYLLSTANLGQLSAGDANLLQSFSATSSCVIPFIDQGCAQIMGHVFWSTAAVPMLYVWGVHDVARSYQFSGGRFNTVPASTGTLQANYPGGVMALSSYNGVAGTGILWAITCDTADNGFFFGPGFTGSATLHAYDANNLANELWNSNQNLFRDGVGTFASFAPPVAVNGKVYVPTFSNQLVVYGLLNGPLPGDVNGDLTVNCSDLAIVKAAYGKSSGQVGFDLRADVNSDGVVNIVDLASVSKQLPGGTVCK